MLQDCSSSRDVPFCCLLQKEAMLVDDNSNTSEANCNGMQNVRIVRIMEHIREYSTIFFYCTGTHAISKDLMRNHSLRIRVIQSVPKFRTVLYKVHSNNLRQTTARRALATSNALIYPSTPSVTGGQVVQRLLRGAKKNMCVRSTLHSLGKTLPVWYALFEQ